MGEYYNEGLIRVLSDMYDPDELVDLMQLTSRELIEAFIDKAYDLAAHEGIEIPESLDLEDDETPEQIDDELEDGFHLVDDEEYEDNDD